MRRNARWRAFRRIGTSLCRHGRQFLRLLMGMFARLQSRRRRTRNRLLQSQKADARRAVCGAHRQTQAGSETPIDFSSLCRRSAPRVFPRLLPPRQFLLDILGHDTDFRYRRFQPLGSAAKLSAPVFDFVVFVDIDPLGVLRSGFRFVIGHRAMLSRGNGRTDASTSLNPSWP
jgi:hypothetical protein